MNFNIIFWTSWMKNDIWRSLKWVPDFSWIWPGPFDLGALLNGSIIVIYWVLKSSKYLIMFVCVSFVALFDHQNDLLSILKPQDLEKDGIQTNLQLENIFIFCLVCYGISVFFEIWSICNFLRKKNIWEIDRQPCFTWKLRDMGSIY